MRRLLVLAFGVSCLFIGSLFSHGSASAASANTSFPAADYGALTLDGGTAFKVPATGLGGRGEIRISCLDPMGVWYGFDSSVTNLTGMPVPCMAMDGGSIVTGQPPTGVTIPVSWTKPGSVDVYVYSIAAESSSTNVRYAELK